MFSPSQLISESIGTDAETSYEIFLALATVTVTSFLIWLVYMLVFRQSKIRNVFLLGISDAGKTTLLLRLIATDSRAKPITVVSQTANVFQDYRTKVKGRLLRLIDIPGADKIRSSVLSQQLARYACHAAVFVVDASTINKEVREAAEWLYSLLADSRVPLRLLVACAKQDRADAKSARVVKSALESEFRALRKTRRAAPRAIDSAGASAGRDLGDAFDFDRVACEFVECAPGAEGARDVAAVERWLDEL